jgi:hypothetical protein
VTTRELIGRVLGGIGGLLLVAIIAFTGYTIADHNRAKVERMTQLCVQQGYSGWIDTSGSTACVGKAGDR